MCPFSESSACRVQKKGFFPKQSTRAARIQRFRCLDCRKSFSGQTHSLTYRERLPYLDQSVFRILAGGVSQRKCAEFLGIHRDTVARKLVRLARFAAAQEVPGAAKVFGETTTAVFDEMETFEHTKMKPISITVAVTEKTRPIRDFLASRFKDPSKLMWLELDSATYQGSDPNTISSVNNDEVITPPMTARPIGASSSPPLPAPIDIGNMPKIIAIVVIRMGRNRTWPASKIASCNGRPARNP